MKKLLISISLMFATLCLYAESKLYVDDFKIKPGETKQLEIKLLNEKVCEGFQFNLALPTGLSFVEDEEEEDYFVKTSRTPKKFNLECSLRPNGSLNFVGYCDGSANKVIAQGDGAVFYVLVKADSEVSLGEGSGTISNVEINLENEDNRHPADDSFKAKIYTEYLVTVISEDETKGNVTGSGTYENGTTVTILATPAEGYHFVKWSDDSEIVSRELTVNSEITLIATFAPNQYAITFDSDGGSAIDDLTVGYKSTLTKPADPTKTGYSFAGWTPEFPETMPLNGASLKAQWTPITYAICYDLAGGALAEGESNPESYTIESEAITLKNPAKTGYTFAGWTGTDLETATSEVSIATGKFGDRSYTATWTPITYAISYDLAGGALAEGESNPENYTIESEAITLKNPAKTGYTFAGWTGTDLEAATSEVSIATGKFGDRSYNATWTPITYAISYDLAGGALSESESNPENYTIESEAITLKNPAKTGYTFAGWTGTDLETATSEVSIATGKFGDRSYTATWTPITYAISYDLAGGALAEGESNPVEYTIESEAVTLKNPAKTGYTFAGWTGTDLEAATSEVSIATGKYGDRSYTATWTPITYAISYDLAGGALAEGESNPVEYTIESEAVTLKNPTKTGYTFAGWTGTDLETATSEVSIATGKYGDRSYIATWTPITYAISYDLAGGALAEGESNPESYTIESEAITLKNPTKTGYTFAGWTGTDLEAATSEVSIATGKYGDRSYTATWTINQYMMTFVLDNGEENIVNTQDYDSALTAPDSPVKTGFTFKGWSPDVPAMTPASDQTFTAQWERNSYLLKFVADGVSVKEESVLYEGEIVQPEDPQKEGYTFTGWTPEVAETMPAQDVTYTAQFIVNQYAVIYMVDGIEWTREYVNYGNEIVLKEYPVEDGYMFSGWTSDDEYQTMPAHDVVFTTSLIATRIAGLRPDVKVVNIYDVRGTLLYRDMPVEQVRKQLPKGIYIINGRKYVVK